MTTPSLLWSRSFMLWLLGSAQSQLGSALASIGLSFLVLHQTGSAGQMALTMACALLPNLLLPLAGALVDRLPLRVPLILADLARGLLQLAVAGLALHLGGVGRADGVPLWAVNLAALLGGFAGIFAQPAASAAFPLLVPEHELERANSLNGAASQGAWLLGTLTGGVLVTRLGPPFALLLDGASFLTMAGLLLFVRLPPRPAAPSGAGVLADLRSGLRLMRRSKVLTLVPIIALVLNAAIAPVTAVMPNLMATLGPGAAGYGVFLALEGGGAVVASVLLAWAGPRLPGKRTTAAGMLLVAGCYGVMGRWPVYPVLLGASALLGAAFQLVNVPLNTLVQRMVPTSFRGRVFGVLGMTGTLGMPLALLLVSPLVDRSAPGVFFAVAAALMAAGALAWVLVARAEPLPPDLTREARAGAAPLSPRRRGRAA